MHYPVQKGVIMDVEKIQQILQHLVTTEMSISLDEHAVMFTEPPANPKKTREDTVRLM